MKSERESIEFQTEWFHYHSLIAQSNEFEMKARAVLMISNLFTKAFAIIFLSILSLQKDHILLDPTGSDISNCLSKGKSQVSRFISAEKQ